MQQTAQRKLKQLDAARMIDELRIPPGNRLETLKGNRIRINGVSGSTISGVSASAGKMVTLKTWKSWITTRRNDNENQA